MFKKNLLKTLLIIIVSIFIFTNLSAYAEKKEKVTYDDARIIFEIDLEGWTEEEVNDRSTYIDKMYTTGCGELSLGVYDIYGYLTAEENMGLSSSQYNYRNLINSEESAQEYAEALINEYKQSFEIIDEKWEYKKLGINYVYIKGTIVKDNDRVNFEQFFTINNGYGIIIQRTATQEQDVRFICKQSIEDIARSAQVTDYEGFEFNIIAIIIDLLITIISYMIYPFIRIKIMKHIYTEKQAKRMILWNSIIVGIIYFVIHSIISFVEGTAAAWSLGPAFFYYIINYEVWVRKIKEKENKSDNDKKMENIKRAEEEEEQNKAHKCNKCGKTIENDLKICPNCKSDHSINKTKIINENSNNNTEKKENNKKVEEKKELEIKEKEMITNSEIDQKYSDLNKLKKLLDKEIITKEEFEIEKKKILNR